MTEIIKHERGIKQEQFKREAWDHEEITQDDTWPIITSFFSQHGLVSQQMSSYNNFLERTLQEVIEENNLITIWQEPQYNPGEEVM